MHAAELQSGADLGGGRGDAHSPPFPKKYYTFMFSLRSPKVTLLLPRPPFSKILDPPLPIERNNWEKEY